MRGFFSASVLVGGTANAAMSSSARVVFDSWPGLWHLSRTVVSSVKSEVMDAHGYAAFIPSSDTPNVLKYSEKVTIDNQSGGLFGFQRYEYRFDPGTSTVSKYLQDGGLFYDLKIELDDGGLRAAACVPHLCVADLYSPEYSFEQDGQSFSLKYAVSGPAKAYSIVTRFSKLGPIAEAGPLHGISIELDAIV